MKKKGFTLIELLAVIIILTVLAVILIPVIQDLIENARYGSAVNSVMNYVREANTQAAIDVGGFEGYALDLSNNNRLESGITDSELAKIKYKGRGPEYVYLHFTDDGKVVSDGHFCIWGFSIDYKMDTGASRSVGNNYCTGEVLVKEHYNFGDPVYYNVTTGKQCSEDAFLANIDEWGSHANHAYVGGKLISRSLEAMPTGLHSGCMKFYTIEDDGDNITLISASNLNEVGPDKYETDPNKFGDPKVLWADTKEGAEHQNVKDFNNITNPEPNTYYVMDLLKDYTKDWKVKTIEEDYTYTYTYKDGEDTLTDSYTIPYHTDGYKARLITTAELTNILDSRVDENDSYTTVQELKLTLGDYLDGSKHPYIYSTNGTDAPYLQGYYTSDAKNPTAMYTYTSNGNWAYLYDGVYGDYISGRAYDGTKRVLYSSTDGTEEYYIYGVRPIVNISRDALADKEIYYAVPNIVNTDVIYKKYESGTILYYNVTTGTECTKSEADNNLSYRHTEVGVKSGCMKFYTLADSEYSDTVSLLLSHPITYTPTAWNENVGNRTFFEPITLLNQIKTDIDGWVGLEEIDNYTTEGLQESGYYKYLYRLTIPFKDMGVKARVTTAAEYDEVIHKTPNFNRSFNSGYTSVAEYESLYSPMGMDPYYCYGGESYDETCNQYGMLGSNTAEIAWLYSDYQRDYSACNNTPYAEYTDEYDGVEESFYVYGYSGGYWGMDMTKSTRGYGNGIMFMIDSPRWNDSGPHLYRPVVEIKKERFGNVTQKDAIEIVVESTTTFTSSLTNPTYSMEDSSIASVSSNGTITGLKIGVTQVKATDGTHTEYAKVVVNHKPNTYYSRGSYVLYNVNTGEECNSTEYRCSDESGCYMFQIFGESPEGNYLMTTHVPYELVDQYETKYHWSAKYAIDKDPNAEARYGEMAYDHWYGTLEWLADLSKNWQAEVPESYIDYMTKEYVVPYGKPAYYENGQPVYAKARGLTIEDVAGMYANRESTYGIWKNVYELIHNTGVASAMYMVEPIYGTGVGNPVKGYASNMWSGTSKQNPETGLYESIHYHSTFISYIVIEVPKSRVSHLIDMETESYEDYILRSTEDRYSIGSSYSWTQSSEDGGRVDIRSIYECTTYSGGYEYCNTYTYAYGLTNGHVKLTGVNGSYTTELNFTVDLQASCGETDVCGRVTAACGVNEGNTSGGTDTTPGTMTSSTSTGTTDTTAPVCVLERVNQLTNGIQPVITCTDAGSQVTIRSQWNVRPVGASQFSDIGIVKSPTSSGLRNGAYYATVQPRWTTSDAISQPSPNDCYYLRYGAQDSAGNWSFYISDKCYYGFSNTNANRLTN